MIKRLLAFTSCISLLLCLCSCSNQGSSTDPTHNTTIATTEPATQSTPPAEETKPPFDLEAYKTLVSLCVENTDSVVDLYVVMAKYEVALWEACNNLNSPVSAEKLLQNAWDTMEKHGISKATAEQVQDVILQVYKKIISTEVYGGEGEALASVFNQYFDAYWGLLNLVNNPVSEYDNFIKSRDNYISIINTSRTKLEALLS